MGEADAESCFIARLVNGDNCLKSKRCEEKCVIIVLLPAVSFSASQPPSLSLSLYFLNFSMHCYLSFLPQMHQDFCTCFTDFEKLHYLQNYGFLCTVCEKTLHKSVALFSHLLENHRISLDYKLYLDLKCMNFCHYVHLKLQETNHVEKEVWKETWRPFLPEWQALKAKAFDPRYLKGSRGVL